MPEIPETTPQDFKDVISPPDRHGEQAVVVGGHAVNLWAEYYLEAEPGISNLGPLTSKDLDLHNETVLHLARVLNQTPQRPPKGDPNPVLGRFVFTTRGGLPATIEVLFTLYGVLPDEVRASSIFIDSLQLGCRVRLPHPLTCLKAKTHNAASLNQQRRQDTRHVRILILCNRAFLRHSLAQADNGRLAERALINSLEALFKFTQSKIAEQVADRFNLDWSTAFPIAELATSPLPRVQRFVRHRLRKAFPACAPPKS